MEATALVADGLHVAPAVSQSINQPLLCPWGRAQYACDTCMSRKMHKLKRVTPVLSSEKLSHILSCFRDYISK